jgi:hypothetical protein
MYILFIYKIYIYIYKTEFVETVEGQTCDAEEAQYIGDRKRQIGRLDQVSVDFR